MTSWKNEQTVQSEEETAQSVDSYDEPAPPNISNDAADFYRVKPTSDRRIHVMGVGNVGKFVAHAIRGIPNPPPVTLIFSRWDKLKEWNASEKKITVITDGDAEAREGFEAEIAIPRIRYHGKEVGLNIGSSQSDGESQITEPGPPQTLPGESTEPISSLIVCSKAPYVLQGLSAVKHRLNKDSVVMFLLNGMGTVEEVNREIFPDPATRPYYMLGINSHGMHSTPDDSFATVHAGFGTMSVGLSPQERDQSTTAFQSPDIRFTANPNKPPTYYDYTPQEQSNNTAAATGTKIRFTSNQRYLLRTILRTPVLGAAAFSPLDLLQMQLEKLAVNCIVNPLTVLLDARNGSILYNFALTRTMRLLLAEISLVIRSIPELRHIPNVDQRFDAARLETRVVAIARATKDNISSMLADVRAGHQTEINYINGWIVNKGEQLGIRCTMNYMLLNLVKGKASLISNEAKEDVPLVSERGAENEEKDDGLKIKNTQAGKGNL